MGCPAEAMSTRTRLTIVLTLLVAFLVTGLMPAAGSWSCPDGTACVYTPGRGFHCLPEQCQLACCTAERPSHGCGRCEHGAVPSAAPAARSHPCAVGEPTHCRYHQAQQVEPAWARAPGVTDFQAHTVTVLPAPVMAPVVTSVSARFAAGRSSPPPSHPTPPSSPRAPPGLDCV
jgi:hypothetical protein